MKFAPEVFDFARLEALTLAGCTVVLIVVNQTQKSQIIQILVGVVVVQMGNLSWLHTQIVIQAKNKRSSAACTAAILPSQYFQELIPEPCIRGRLLSLRTRRSLL